MMNLFSLAAISLKGSTGLPNDHTDIVSFIAQIVYMLAYLGGGLAIIFIMVGSIQMITSGGSPARIKQGRETLIYAVVGLIVSIGAAAVVNFISDKI